VKIPQPHLRLPLSRTATELNLSFQLSNSKSDKALLTADTRELLNKLDAIYNNEALDNTGKGDEMFKLYIDTVLEELKREHKVALTLKLQ
jgi:hypothetical protein